MSQFRTLLAVLFTCIVAYTAVVITNHGFGLFGIFFGDIATMGWPGQFNVDFMSLLMLSGLWVAWRHNFSGAGLALGVLALFGGGLFLTAYLLVMIAQARGDVAELLLGKARAARYG